MASIQEGEIQQANQKQVSTEYQKFQSAECKVTATEQSAAEKGKEKSQSAWKDNPKIKDLTKTAEDQKNEIEELQQKIAASQVALAKEEVATFELDKKVTQQAQKVRNGEILVTHLNRELKERKESEEWMNDRLEKERENLIALNTMFKAVQKEGSRVNHALREERKNRAQKEAELKFKSSRLSSEGAGLESGVTNLMNEVNEHNNEIEKLRTANGKLGDNVYQQEITITKMKMKLGKMENRIENLKILRQESESKINGNNMKELKYKKVLSDKERELKKNQQQRKAEICELATQISAYEAECERRGLNIEADKKMKINMTGTIEFLRQKNDALLRELTSGIVGKIRIVKQFFGAAISAIRARFH